VRGAPPRGLKEPLNSDESELRASRETSASRAAGEVEKLLKDEQHWRIEIAT
jgi:hypothetical protein